MQDHYHHSCPVLAARTTMVSGLDVVELMGQSSIPDLPVIIALEPAVTRSTIVLH